MIGAAQLIIFVVYKFYKGRQKRKDKRREEAKVAEDLRNSVFRISGLRPGHQPREGPAWVNPGDQERGEVDQGQSALQDLARILRQAEK